MNKVLIVVCLVLLYSVDFKALALPTYSANDDGTISAYVDADEYESLGDDMWSMQSKRFWSPHPSDYNPLRRPVPVPRGSKRGEDIPYHPLPRITTMKQQRSMGHSDEYPADSDLFFEGGKKRQTRPTTLIFRLGSWGLRKPKTGPSPPPNTSA